MTSLILKLDMHFEKTQPFTYCESSYYMVGFVLAAKEAKMNKIWSLPYRCSDIPC